MEYGLSQHLLEGRSEPRLLTGNDSRSSPTPLGPCLGDIYTVRWHPHLQAEGKTEIEVT